MRQTSEVKEEEVIDLLPNTNASQSDDFSFSTGLLTPVSNGRVWVPPLRSTEDTSASRRETWVAMRVDGRQLTKRTFDIVVSTVLLMLFAPLFIAIAIAIKLTSPGPIFFAQARRGKGRRLFPCLKFRTMIPDAERILDADDRLQELYKQYDHKLPAEQDSRISGIGRWLRASSLDELPQLLNVLVGQMSIVGPRPRTPAEADKFPDPYQTEVIYDLRPGLTGLWQICGRSHVKGKARLDLDLRYARMHSFWNDLVILARTPYAVLEHLRNGAH